MKGMIKKDLLMIKNNYKILILSVVIYFIYSVIFEFDMSFFLPFMGFTIAMTTFSYDDFNNWHTYAASLPQGRINIVKSKYLTSIVLILVLSLVSILSSTIISSVRNNLNMEELLSSIMGFLLGIIFILSIIYPFIFKYGAEKGRNVMFIVAICIVGIFWLFTKIIKIDISPNLIKTLEDYLPLISITLSIIFTTISYFISKKIYLNKEF